MTGTGTGTAYVDPRTNVGGGRNFHPVKAPPGQLLPPGLEPPTTVQRLTLIVSHEKITNTHRECKSSREHTAYRLENEPLADLKLFH